MPQRTPYPLHGVGAPASVRPRAVPASQSLLAATGDDAVRGLSPLIEGLLDAAWLAKRARSTAPFGSDVARDEHTELNSAIAEHPQFVIDHLPTHR